MIRRSLARLFGSRGAGAPVAAAASAPPAVPDAAALPEWAHWIDEPQAEGMVAPGVRVSGWALHRNGIRAVVIRVGEREYAARTGVARRDVEVAYPGYPDSTHGGFEFSGEIPLPAGRSAPSDRVALAIVAIARDGRERVIATRSLIDPAAPARWRAFASPVAEPFALVPALSGVARGGATGLDSWYAPYVSATTRIGMRVPILYLRTTRGAAHDYAFDPAFDVSRMAGTRTVADDALASVLAYAVAHRLPLLVTLNGGIWSDAAGTAPEWDLTDRLEQDLANCQWNERDEVMADDHLTHLPGSHAAPELARALTLNVHAASVRRYKKRNLQQAAALVAGFMREHGALLIGVNLDPDVYINPFFGETQWYDYNPGTLRQFREWLAGSGPYAGDCDAEVPDLRSYRRDPPLTLEAVRALARRSFATWDDVDPPRSFARGGEMPYWRDAWVHEWEVFRRHLVQLHYDELAQWACAAGLPRALIWSSQGLMPPAEGAMPFALRVTSPVKNHDSGGVSVEGSKPRDGHLGAILYGAAAANDVPMEDGRTLFAALAAVDPRFAIVEFNTADLRRPEVTPGYATAYRALRDAWNAGARFVSPMAWNGANGAHAGTPGHVAYTAWRNTPLEEAAKDFLLARAGLVPGARLWTFGSARHADSDGWTAEHGEAAPRPGHLALAAGADGVVTLVSPGDLALAPSAARTLVLGLARTAGVRNVALFVRDVTPADAREADDAWALHAAAEGSALRWCEAGLVVPLAPRQAGLHAQLRIRIAFEDAVSVSLARIAVLPLEPIQTG